MVKDALSDFYSASVQNSDADSRCVPRLMRRRHSEFRKAITTRVHSEIFEECFSYIMEDECININAFVEIWGGKKTGLMS